MRGATDDEDLFVDLIPFFVYALHTIEYTFLPHLRCEPTRAAATPPREGHCC